MEKGEELVNVEETQLQADGKEAVLLTSKVPLKNEKGEIFGMLGMYMDITSLKQREEEVVALAKFPSENPSPVLRISREGNIIYNNETSAPLIRAWQFGEDGKAEGKVYEYVMECFSSNANVQDKFKCDNGQIFLCTFTSVDNAEYINVYALDITKREKTEKELQRKLEDLENFKEITIDRELKMIQLKEEVNMLAKELGRTPPYNVEY